MRSRYEGVLLGTALGDALGLATEGMAARAIARHRGAGERYGLWPGVGLVSDDTEQAALVAASLASHPRDEVGCQRAFRRSLLGWFARLPWGLGWATLRACVRIALGLRESGVRSAGNGASMRAAIVGVFFRQDPARRRTFGRALARVTHTDERGVQAALYVAELTALACREDASDRLALARDALAVVDEPTLRAAIARALVLAADTSTTVAGGELGNTGFVLHTIPLCVHAFVRHGDDVARALREVIVAGGDTDSTAAIVGAWVGALHGVEALPADLIARLQRGPFGQAHLRALAADLTAAEAGTPAHTAHFSAPLALLRNLALYPLVLAHGVRVLASR